MPMYDYQCSHCKEFELDVLEPISAPVRHCKLCFVQGIMDRVHLPTGRGTVIGDECDVTVKHGLCNADGTPRRFTSKSDMRREAEKRGLVSHVEHMPGRSSDKSKHTTRWI